MRIAVAPITFAITVATTIEFAALAASSAYAFPDGAPWGAANPAAVQNCGTCHFGADPVPDSDALVVKGLPREPEPGATYDLEVVFDAADIVVAGFQLIAQAADEQVGTFASSAADVEFIGAAIRSTAPVRGTGRVTWSLEWRAPRTIPADIMFHAAASAANDDGSPFGDTIHFRTYELKTR